MLRQGFFKVPLLPGAWLVAKTENPLVQLIWNTTSVSPVNLAVNAPHTLPTPLKPKAQLNAEIAKANPDAAGLKLKLKQTFGFAKQLLKFYKNGIVNVWNNHKFVSDLQKKTYLLEADATGAEVRKMPTNFLKLTEELLTVIYESKSQLKSKSSSMTSSLPEANLFAISRLDYQTIRRTKKDFYKLPSFAVIFVIFEELTPLLCYFLPEVTPSTCVLPNLLPKLWGFPKYTAELDQLKRQRYQTIDEKVNGAMQTAYLIPLDEARLLCRVSRIIPRLIPSNWYPESTIRQRLQQYYNYLVVDNYYLSGLNGNGTLFDLLAEELAEACLERQLIEDINVFKQISDIADPVARELAELELRQKLQAKLAKFIVDFDQYNIGVLAMDTGKIDARTVVEVN